MEETTKKVDPKPISYDDLMNMIEKLKNPTVPKRRMHVVFPDWAIRAVLLGPKKYNSFYIEKDFLYYSGADVYDQRTRERSKRSMYINNMRRMNHKPLRRDRLRRKIRKKGMNYCSYLIKAPEINSILTLPPIVIECEE